MRWDRRKKLTALERGIDFLEASEVRVMADLRNAGWGFSSADQARRRLKAERTLRGASEQAIDDYIRSGRTPHEFESEK